MFISLNPLDYEIGRAIKKKLFTLIDDNLDDHESRLNNIEAGVGKVEVWNTKIINAAYLKSSNTVEGFGLHYVAQDFTLTSAVVVNLETGGTGSVEFDVLVGNSPTGAFTTVFSTRPSKSGQGESTNAVFSTTAITAGQYLRLDLTAFQVPQGDYVVILLGEVS